MTVPVLNYREWLEQIVATGAQRSGFAAEILRELDELTDMSEANSTAADQILDIAPLLADAPGKSLINKAKWVNRAFNDLADRTGDSWKYSVPTICDRLAQWSCILDTLQAYGIVERGTVPDDMAGIIRMFVG